MTDKKKKNGEPKITKTGSVITRDTTTNTNPEQRLSEAAAMGAALEQALKKLKSSKNQQQNSK